MPIVTTKDDDQRRLTVTVSDPWSVEEIAVAIDRQLTDHLWKYGTIYDLRRANWLPTDPDVLWLVKHGQQQVARHGARGPVAVLIDGNAHSAALRQYAAYGGAQSHVLVRVFTDEAAANAWLGSQQQ